MFLSYRFRDIASYILKVGFFNTRVFGTIVVGDPTVISSTSLVSKH